MDGFRDRVSGGVADKKYANPSVSIAMATFNGEKYLLEQLESLASQTLLPIELVVTDDGSSDRTVEIAKAFSESAPFDVRLHQNPCRLGYAENFLGAVNLCRGKIIAFCDQDDKWHPEKLRICIREFEDPSVVLCVHSSIVWNQSEEAHQRIQGFNKRSVFLPNSTDPLTIYPGFSMLFRKSLIEKVERAHRPRDIHTLGDKNLMMVHDQFVSFLAAVFGKIICLPDCLALYRQHEGNTSGVSPERSLRETLRLSINTLNYYELSLLSIECASFLETICDAAVIGSKDRIAAAAKRFRKRATFQRLRASIYQDESRVLMRLHAFVKILSAGGYYSDQAEMLLGPRAAAKDLLFGVPGFYKSKILRQEF